MVVVHPLGSRRLWDQEYFLFLRLLRLHYKSVLANITTGRLLVIKYVSTKWIIHTLD